MALLGQDSLLNVRKDSLIGEVYIAVKAINITSFIWDLGTIDYSFDGVVKHVYHGNFPENDILRAYELNDTIRNISFQGDSNDILVENQLYNTCISFIYVKKGDMLNLPHSNTSHFYPMVVARLCSDFVECHFIERRDTLDNGKKIVITTTYYKKYSSKDRKYLPDLYSDSGYSISTYTIYPGRKTSVERQAEIFFQTGALASRVKRRKGVERKTV